MKHILIIVLGLALAACANKAELGDVIGTPEDLYNEGLNELLAKDYETAVHTFEELERQHPYSLWATRAQMMTAYAYYRAGLLDEAVAATGRFVRLHPGHKDLAYMYYLRGLAYYVRISDVTRDQGFTRQALAAFEEVLKRFPNSEYAQDSRLKITLTKDHLAGKEMDVGRYYQEQKRYLAAINRFKEVVMRYETSSQTPEALYRLTESYRALGIADEAKQTAAVLGYNYPESAWYEEAYALLTAKDLAPAGQEKAWYNQLGKGISELF